MPILPMPSPHFKVIVQKFGFMSESHLFDNND